MIGKVNNAITVKKLYDYAVKHDYLDTEVSIVLDIISRDNKQKISALSHNIVSTANINTTDFSNLIEYTTEDLIALFSN